MIVYWFHGTSCNTAGGWHRVGHRAAASASSNARAAEKCEIFRQKVKKIMGGHKNCFFPMQSCEKSSFYRYFRALKGQERKLDRVFVTALMLRGQGAIQAMIVEQS